MNVDEELQRVISALSTIYSIPGIGSCANTTNREQANQYLTQYQRSSIAWEISNRLLSAPAVAVSQQQQQQPSQQQAQLQQQTQIYFFAAQTIHTKCRSDILQLPPAQWTSLRDELMNHLIQFCGNSSNGSSSDGVNASSNISGSGSNNLYKPVVSRLAMALCALSVQIQWYDVVDQLLLQEYHQGNTGSGTNSAVLNIPQAKMNLVLELAQLLPEEATSYRLLVQDPNIRRGFVQGLVDKSPQVFDFYHSIVSQYCDDSTSNMNRNVNGPDGAAGAAASISTCTSIADRIKIKEQVLKCIHAWVRYIHIPPKLLQETPLVDWVFSILLNQQQPNDPNTHGYSNYTTAKGNENDIGIGGDMFELAVDVVIEILRCYPSDGPQNEGLVQRMIPLVMSLAQPQQPPQMSPFQKTIEEEDEDGMRAYCRIFTEMGESYMSLIMHHEDLNQVALVELVLTCSALPDREIATITLHFWYRFVSWLEDLQPYEFRQFQIDNMAPQITKLVSTCTTLLQYPSDVDELLQDQMDDIQRVRFSVCDTVEDCCRLLGGDSVLQNVGRSLQNEITRLTNLAPTSTATAQEDRLRQWHGVEACLLALSSASRYISSDESQVLPFVMKLLPDLVPVPTAVVHLRTTANHLVGGYAPWLAAHTDFLQPILPFLAQGLSEPICAPSAALAIKHLCESCNSSFALGDSVLQLYDGILKAQQEQNNSVLDIKDELEVLEGACIAVSRQLDDMVRQSSQNPQELEGTISNYVSRIVTPIGSKLVEYTQQSSLAGPKQIVAEVERLTVLIRFLKVPSPSAGKSGTSSSEARAKLIVDLMAQCWPLLDNLSQKFITDINLAEKLCRLHKHCIRGCGANLYKPLFEKLRLQLVSNYSQSHLSPYLYAASICISEYGSDVSFSGYLLQMFEEMSNVSFTFLQTHDNLRDHPDVVEELLFLAVRMIQNCPQPFVQGSPLFHAFIKCAALGMKQDHRDANRGSLNFLEVSFAYGIDLQKGGSNDAIVLTCRHSLETAVAAEGQQIVANAILSLLGDLPCYRVACNQGSIAGILFKLHCLCPALLKEWIKVPLDSVPEGAKSLFLNIFQPSTSRRDFFENIEHFAKVCDQNQKMGQ